MFGMGFFELIVIFGIALVVFGPEKLPEVIRNVVRVVSQVKNSLRNTQQDLERELGVDDIRRDIHNQNILKEIEDSAKDLKQGVEDAADLKQPPTTP